MDIERAKRYKDRVKKEFSFLFGNEEVCAVPLLSNQKGKVAKIQALKKASSCKRSLRMTVFGGQHGF